MMMENLYKQFVALGTRWNNDLFLRARVNLTLTYVGIAAVILSSFSYLLYEQLLLGLKEAIDERVLDSLLRDRFIEHAAAVLQSRILLVDGIVLLFVFIFGYILTAMTLRPIRIARDREQRFLADAAHELRMPLAVMKTGVEVALRGDANLSPRTKQFLEENIEEIDSLIHIANGLLSLASEKSEEKEDRLPVRVYDEVLGAVKKVSPLAERKRQTVAVLPCPSLHAVSALALPKSLSRVFENILENAIKYAPNDTHVEVQIERNGQLVSVSIKDSGIGIAPSDLPHVTEPFFRADVARTGSEGSGLGLSIVDEILRAHGGNLEIVSKEGVGTTATVRLPIYAPLPK